VARDYSLWVRCQDGDPLRHTAGGIAGGRQRDRELVREGTGVADDGTTLKHLSPTDHLYRT
jgi:hypothetical protein